MGGLAGCRVHSMVVLYPALLVLARTFVPEEQTRAKEFWARAFMCPAVESYRVYLRLDVYYDRF
jgi:hypothetical protein